MADELDIAAEAVQVDGALVAAAAEVASLESSLQANMEVGLMMIVTEVDGTQRVIRAPVEMVELLPRATADFPDPVRE